MVTQIADHTIEVFDTGIYIKNLEIPSRDVADFLRGISEEEWEANLMQALQIGILCLQQTGTSLDTEFLKRQCESLMADVEKAVSAIPAAAEKELLNKIGTKDGQVLAPVRMLIEQTSKTNSEKLKEVSELLSNELDPSKGSTTLGKALNELKLLLDPQRKDSIQGSLAVTIQNITSKDGDLTKAIKAVVTQAVKPLVDEVDRLGKDLKGTQATAEALQQTTEKGSAYEEEVVVKLQSWAKGNGGQVTYVGTDNKPGDIVVRFPADTAMPGAEVNLVLEVRDRSTPKGHKGISDDLAKAMAVRGCNCAIYLSRSADGLAKEIGEWGEGDCEGGPYLATVDSTLIVAIRYLICQLRIKQIASEKQIDLDTISPQLNRIKTSLKTVATINTKITGIRHLADETQELSESLRDDIRRAVTTMEGALRSN